MTSTSTAPATRTWWRGLELGLVFGVAPLMLALAPRRMVTRGIHRRRPRLPGRAAAGSDVPAPAALGRGGARARQWPALRLAHIVVYNFATIALAALGRPLFAATYERRRSTLLVSLEHGL